MYEITAKNISIEFPVYTSQRRSIRHALFIDKVKNALDRSGGSGVGGRIGHDSEGRTIINALEDLTFSIRQGDRVGLIGLNGSGKTTLLRVMSGIYEPPKGELVVRGQVMPLFNINEGIDMDATGVEAIQTRGILLGLSRQQIEDCIQDIIEFSDLGNYIDMPIRTYSAGMLVRLAFATATAVHPEILLMDEVIGAGAATFIEKAEARLKTFVEAAGIVVVASHSRDILQRWCNKAILLHQGRMIEFSDVDTVIEAYDRLVAG
jgi:ABC-type polysaccharide/polyol phosphate transport system ATPase subunit